MTQTPRLPQPAMPTGWLDLPQIQGPQINKATRMLPTWMLVVGPLGGERKGHGFASSIPSMLLGQDH